MRPLQSAFTFPLRCTVFLLNADPSLLTWLCTLLSAGLPRWTFLALLPLSCFKHAWHRFLGCRSLLCRAVRALFQFFQARLLSARDLQHLTSRLRCCLLEVCIIAPGDCAAVCSRLGFSMFGTLLRVIVWAICAYLCTFVVTPTTVSVPP